ncbi:MAG: nucleotidyltransferase domain-containing protein [Bacteroidales bacterium]|nr:nucleotidyltransferase domain-containing protein [Bacteroidales bacterium]
MNKKTIKERLFKQKKRLKLFGISQIGLFGSYVRNENNDKSDIDILIDFSPKDETFDNFISVSEIIENLFKGYKVEITTKKGLSKYIGPYIIKEVEYV